MKEINLDLTYSKEKEGEIKEFLEYFPISSIGLTPKDKRFKNLETGLFLENNQEMHVFSLSNSDLVLDLAKIPRDINLKKSNDNYAELEYKGKRMIVYLDCAEKQECREDMRMLRLMMDKAIVKGQYDPNVL
jgi:hypothetical protein